MVLRAEESNFYLCLVDQLINWLALHEHVGGLLTFCDSRAACWAQTRF
jgi:hypothetical protein